MRTTPFLLLVSALALSALALPATAQAEQGGTASTSTPSSQPAGDERSPAGSTSTTAAQPQPTPLPVPAEPVVASGAVAPVRPPRVEVGTHGAIELGRQRPAASRWKGFPISLSLRDAPLVEVLRSFSKIAGVNLVLDPAVKGEVTVELKDVPWDQALYVILKSQGMGAEIDGRVWVVSPN